MFWTLCYALFSFLFFYWIFLINWNKSYFIRSSEQSLGTKQKLICINNISWCENSVQNVWSPFPSTKFEIVVRYVLYHRESSQHMGPCKSHTARTGHRTPDIVRMPCNIFYYLDIKKNDQVFFNIMGWNKLHWSVCLVDRLKLWLWFKIGTRLLYTFILFPQHLVNMSYFIGIVYGTSFLVKTVFTLERITWNIKLFSVFICFEFIFSSPELRAEVCILRIFIFFSGTVGLISTKLDTEYTYKKGFWYIYIRFLTFSLEPLSQFQPNLTQSTSILVRGGEIPKLLVHVLNKMGTIVSEIRLKTSWYEEIKALS